MSGIIAQTSLPKTGNQLNIKNAVNLLPSKVSLNNSPLNYTASKPFLSPNYYSAQLGFFCKKEIKMDKFTKVQFKFRLGGVDDCDRLEGKQKYH